MHPIKISILIIATQYTIFQKISFVHDQIFELEEKHHVCK